MTSDELKKKIAEIIDNAFENRCRKTNCHNCDLYPDEMCQPNMYADALIAAGIRFGENLTATFDRMALGRERDLERRLAEAMKAMYVYERALYYATLNGETADEVKYNEALKRAQKDFAENKGD